MMTKRIHVGNLPASTTEHELSSLFERVGRVGFVRLIRDRETGRSKGFGFIEMGDGEAEQAIQQLNGVDLHGHALSVIEARPRPESSASPGVPPSRLFVGNLPYDATSAELQELFSSVGPVVSIFLPVDQESRKPRGFAFVDFSDRAHAEEAVGRFHQQPFKGRVLVVNEARAKESHPPSSFSPRASQPHTEGPPALPDEPSVRPGSSRRHFGPDASPRQSRKPPNRDSQPERSRGKALRERKGGQFFSGAEDDPYEAAFPAEPLAAQEREPEGGEQP
jgi:RNA recognition motif-containing protein